LRKQPLTEQDLPQLLSCFDSGNFDNVLFISMLLIGFNALLHIREITFPDSPAWRSSLKLTMWHTCQVTPQYFSFHLPCHKGNRFFDGNTVLIEHKKDSTSSAYPFFISYLCTCNSHFPSHPELWLTSIGKVPTYSWFVSWLKNSLGHDVGSHLVRSGGATALVLVGVSDNLIQLMVHWSSEAFHVYIHLHPVLLHLLLHTHSSIPTFGHWLTIFILNTTILPSLLHLQGCSWLSWCPIVMEAPRCWFSAYSY